MSPRVAPVAEHAHRRGERAGVGSDAAEVAAHGLADALGHDVRDRTGVRGDRRDVLGGELRRKLGEQEGVAARLRVARLREGVVGRPPEGARQQR